MTEVKCTPGQTNAITPQHDPRMLMLALVTGLRLCLSVSPLLLCLLSPHCPLWEEVTTRSPHTSRELSSPARGAFYSFFLAAPLSLRDLSSRTRD